MASWIHLKYLKILINRFVTFSELDSLQPQKGRIKWYTALGESCETLSHSHKFYLKFERLQDFHVTVFE